MKKFLKKLWNKQKTLNNTIKEKMKMTGHWIAFGILLLIIPIGFGWFGVKYIKKYNLNEQQKKSMHLWVGKSTLLFWLYDLLYMSIFNNWLTWIFVFGTMSVIIIFVNLTGAFLSGNKALYKLLPFELLIGVGLSTYLIYIIPNERLQNIVTAVVAALYGGILTLVGVSLTIRHSDKERREEEKKNARPLFAFNILTEQLEDIRHKKVCVAEMNDVSEYDKCHVVAELENSNHSVFIIKGVYHDGKWFNMTGNTTVLPSTSVYIDFYFNEGINNIFLHVQDELDSSYYYEIKVLELEFLDKHRDVNQLDEKLYMVREINELSFDEINNRISVNP